MHNHNIKRMFFIFINNRIKMSNSEKTVFSVYACSFNGDWFLYFFNWTEKIKKLLKGW